jgi:hypothetical protein
LCSAHIWLAGPLHTDAACELIERAGAARPQPATDRRRAPTVFINRGLRHSIPRRTPDRTLRSYAVRPAGGSPSRAGMCLAQADARRDHVPCRVLVARVFDLRDLGRVRLGGDMGSRQRDDAAGGRTGARERLPRGDDQRRGVFVCETSFIATWWRFRMKRGRNRQFALAEDFPAERDRHPLDDDWWASKRPRLGAIDVPALVCGSWSDHGLHTRGCGKIVARQPIGPGVDALEFDSAKGLVFVSTASTLRQLSSPQRSRTCARRVRRCRSRVEPRAIDRLGPLIVVPAAVPPPPATEPSSRPSRRAMPTLVPCRSSGGP